MNLALRLARWIALGLHLIMLPIFIVQGLNVPTEGVLFLVALWVALTIVMALAWRRWSVPVMLIPVLDVFVVYGVTALGRALFGWQG